VRTYSRILTDSGWTAITSSEFQDVTTRFKG
jgi:hypothetical protein